MDENLFGEPFDTPQVKHADEAEKKRRRWENAFQRWSNEKAADGLTRYGACGYGAICDYCEDNDYGRPCVRALNAMLRDQRRTIDYDSISYEEAFDGGTRR